jgi:hypothetical protein
MAINYPSSLDDFTNPTADDSLNSDTVPHADQHANLNDAVEALEAKVGVNSSAVTSSLDYKVSTLETDVTTLETDVTTLETDVTTLEGRVDNLVEVQTAEQTASYTLVLADGGTVVEMNVASANDLTVPPNSSVAFPVGTQITVLQTGAGQTTLVAGSGVTINSADGNLKITGQWSAATLLKRATDTWVAIGSLSA